MRGRALPPWRTIIALMNTLFGELRNAFTQIGVNNLAPGFYDDPAFIQGERQLPTLLDSYAEYCRLAAATENQASIEQKIRGVVSFLSPLVAAHGLDGKCMPTTLLVQRFLDAEGHLELSSEGRRRRQLSTEFEVAKA